MSTPQKAMCLTITPSNDVIILEYRTPFPKRMPADWDKYIRRQRVVLRPTREFEIPVGEYDITQFRGLSR